MGQKLFGIDISGLVHKNLSPGLVAVTITRTIKGTRTATNPTAGTNPTSTTHSAKGFREDYADSQINGTTVQRGDRKIGVIGDSISPAIVPSPGDEITIQGETMKIVERGVKTDPASALYTCQVRAF